MTRTIKRIVSQNWNDQTLQARPANWTFGKTLSMP
jgi:hypothetical protein